MVKTTQRKFIGLAIFILFLVFTVVFFATYMLLNMTTTNTIVDQINNVEKIMSEDRDATPPPNSLYAEFYLYHNQVHVEYKNYDQNSFSTIEDVEDVINLIAKSSTKQQSGQHKNFMFRVVSSNVSSEYPLYKLYAVDASAQYDILSKSTITALIVLSSLYIVVIFLVYLCSFRILKPMFDNFEKQKAFISDASHELKTPLSIINANADVLSAQSQSKWLDNIKSQTQRMNVLVTNMLSLSKLEEGRIYLNKEEFDFSEEVLESTLPFEAFSYEKHKFIEYNIQPNVIVCEDKNSVKQLVNILLDNAVKYASENGKIVVSVYKKKQRAILSVFNTGSSVPDEQSERIFERFYRADSSRSRESGGSGLGLAIAKKICTTNKWKIFAQSKLNQSMTITVVI